MKNDDNSNFETILLVLDETIFEVFVINFPRNTKHSILPSIKAKINRLVNNYLYTTLVGILV